jgi:23S rRNA pseudouridine1911/1915/1917 synthase
LNKKVIQKFKVKKPDTNIRLDLFLSEKLSITRSMAQKLIREKRVLVNSKETMNKYLVQTGDRVVILKLIQSKVPKIAVTYEDNDILVIDKPAGITTHPAPGETDQTISEIFIDKYTSKAKTSRDNIVHRLDKGTSGLMVLAKNERAKEDMVGQFALKGVNKRYLALVAGKVLPTEGIIDMPLSRNLVVRNKIAPAEEGKDAKTLYKVEQYFKGYTLLSVNPKTGRTHQIRVHFSAIGHPLYGDIRYGARETNANRMFLHATELSFIHPTTGKRVNFVSKIPKELETILEQLVIE